MSNHSRLTLKEKVKITTRGYGILKEYCPGLAVGKAVSTVLSAICPFVSIYFLSHIINEISENRRVNILMWYVGLIIGINFVFSIIIQVVKKITDEKESVMWQLFGKIFSDKQMSLDYVDLENASIQEQYRKSKENLYMFGNGLAQLVWGIEGLVRASINIILSISLTVTLFTSLSGRKSIDNPIWSIVIILCIVATAIYNSKATILENNAFDDWCNSSVWFNRIFDFFGWKLYTDKERAKDVRMYEQDVMSEHVFDRLLSRNPKEDGQIHKMSLYPALSALIIGLNNSLCYLFVVIKTYYGAFEIGNMIQYIMTLGLLGKGIQGIMFVLADNEVYCNHLKSLYEFLDLPNKKYQGNIPIEKRGFCNDGDNEYEIEFCNVSYKYEGSKHYALRNVNLKLDVGKRFAVVGQNGSGKTTFIKLLCRLYDPTEGEIMLNGIDIKKYDYQEYMSIFSVVFQDFKIFAFTLGENVATNTEYNRTDVKDCLQKAGFAQCFANMSKGVDTPLYKEFENDGVEISGGEEQKIAISRSLFKNAPIMVLDEPTAALDPLAEYEIYTKLNEMIENKTAIYISHRLSSCRFCDDIIVFDKGKIVQHGSHEELKEVENGKYFELWNAQAQYYNH